VSQVATSFPVLQGSEALLKPLSEEGERSVYLLAIDGADKPWVMKMLPRQSEPAAEPDALGIESRWLRRMQSPNLARVLSTDEVDGKTAIVMDHVAGKPLADIVLQAERTAALFPPEFGLVVAHDALAALGYFHDFESASRVHGNVSARTIMIGYSGDAKVAGYRLGGHLRVEPDTLFAKDVRPVAEILSEIPFERFPQELANLVPRLLDEATTPMEALAAASSFVRERVPTVEERQRVAAWLEKIFPGERDREARERAELLAEGLKLIAKSKAEKRGWARSPAAGDEIGEYRIVEMLGEGGMGKVYEAESLKTGKRVALKVLHPKGRTAAIEERFQREAESILRISNPHVVEIERFGASAEGKFLYLAMELLHGESLDHALKKEGPFAPLRALRIASQICQALVSAHEAGVIHRDLKPGNVMLVERGGERDFVKVLDFGLARLDMAEAALTRVGDLIGTFQYMAPEQGQGAAATPKIDVYAVGELLYEMLTRRLPHEGTENILGRKAGVEPVPILTYRPDLPADVSRVIMKALARKPEARHASMAELGADIDSVIALVARPTIFRRTWFKVAAASATAAIVAAAALSLSAKRQPQTAESEAAKAVLPAPTPQAAPATQVSPSPIPEEPPPLPAPAPAPARPPHPKLGTSEARPARRKAEDATADHLLESAEAAFESGDRKEAIRLGTQALKVGGGLRAHLSLAGYYQSMRFFAEAMEHYKAALKLDPGNGLAAKGVEMIERKLASGQ